MGRPRIWSLDSAFAMVAESLSIIEDSRSPRRSPVIPGRGSLGDRVQSELDLGPARLGLHAERLKVIV